MSEICFVAENFPDSLSHRRGIERLGIFKIRELVIDSGEKDSRRLSLVENNNYYGQVFSASKKRVGKCQGSGKGRIEVFLVARLALLFLRFIIYAESGEENAGTNGEKRREEERSGGQDSRRIERVSGHAAE